MKSVWIIRVVVGMVVICSTPALAEPWMSPPVTRDDLGPLLLYKNQAVACIGNSAWDDQQQAHDWELGLRTTASGYTPVEWNKNIVWPNDANVPDDANVPFTLTFTKSTGAVEFTVEGLTGPGTISYDYEEYAGRGFDQLHVMAAAVFDLVETFTCSIKGLQLNGNSYNFVDLTASKTHHYTTISGIGYEDFTLTGYINLAWTDNPYGDDIQALFAFGEPHPGGPPDDPDKFTKVLTSDLNGDNIVDFRDFAILASRWSNECVEPDWCDGSDLNQTCIVDGNDLAIITEEWLEIKYGGGSGTENDPYLIYTPAQLNAVGVSDDLDAHFRLMADIDLSGYTGSSFNTIGSWHFPFTGVFNGNDFAILNFSQGGDPNQYPYPVGLFVCVYDPNAVIKNLRLINPTLVTQNCSDVAALCGWIRDGLISRCRVEGGNVTALGDDDNYIGGLVGVNQGTVFESAATSDVEGYDCTGGLVGYNGGIIESCFANGNDVKGHDHVGALAGYNSYSYMGVISNSYARRSVFAHDGVGGLTGYNGGIIENCYATGSTSENSDYAGGLAGRSIGVINASFWDIETGGPDNGFGTPKTTAQMQTKDTFTSAGWDFTSPVWTIYEGNDYPRLWWEVAPSPDIMTWDSPPVVIGPYSITMTATTATSYDSSGVQYYFNNVTDPNHDSGWQDSTTYLDTALQEQTQYTYRVKARDKSPMKNETHYSTQASATTTVDTAPPVPDPTQWASPPSATSPSSIIMSAVTAVDGAGVQYYFSNLTDPSHDSGWQDSTTYEDTDLDEITQYTYRVKARDKSANQNETGWSSTASATTQDGTPPTPNPMTWAETPVATGPYSITMTATTASDPCGVQYYFNNVTNPNHDSGWLDSPTYEDTDLNPEIEYTYQVKARDKSENYNQTAYSPQASATTPVDTTTPQPDPMTWASVPEPTGPYSITMTATTATDEGPVKYYFNNITDPNHDSGWQSSLTYEDLGLSFETEYVYQVKARDKSLNETAYSSQQSATTLSPTPPVEEQESFFSIAPQDGRVWNLGSGTQGIDYVHNDAEDKALRLGDYAGQEGYKVILSFDTSFLPEDCNFTSATLQLIRGYKSSTAKDPFTWAGDCLIDVANPYFSTNADLQESDWEAEANAVAVANFLADPGRGQPMVSTEFNAQGLSFINTNGITQLRVYFATPTNFDSEADYIGFYPGEYELLEMRPKFTVRYKTTTPTVRVHSIAAEDGRVWDINDLGEGIGFDDDDINDIALRLGDYSGTEGYRNILSFDTSCLPHTAQILSARLELTRGADVGVSPFNNWAGDCVIDVADPPHFGLSHLVQDSDWQEPTSAVAVASFLEDPGKEQPMISTVFNADGLSNINVNGRTQIRVYFTTSTNGDNSSDFVGFYSGESESPKRPKLAVRYVIN